MSSTRDICEALEVVISKNQLDDISVIRLSMTSKEMKELVTLQLLDSILTSGILKSESLATVFLFPYLYQGENYNEEVLKYTLTHLGCLVPKAIYDLEVIESIINIIKNSNYDCRSHYYSVISNLAYMANHDVLELFVDKNMPMPINLDQKLKMSAMDEITANRTNKAEKYFQTYSYVIERKIEDKFESILKRIKNHKPKLNGGGDTSIPEIDHPLPKQAAKVYKIIKNALESGDHLLDEFNSIYDLVFKKLSHSKIKNFITSYGERDSSTTNLYSNILSDMVRTKRLVHEWLGVAIELSKLSYQINKTENSTFQSKKV